MNEIPFEATPELAAYHAVKLESRESSITMATLFDEARQAWFKSGSAQKTPEHVAMMTASKAREATAKPYRTRLTELAEPISNDLMVKYQEAWRDWYYKDENGKPYKDGDSISPCGRYKLVVTTHPTGPGTWGYTQGKIYDLEKSETEPLAVVRRNYSSFWHKWIQHSVNGKWYLWAGESYMGYTCVDLEDGSIRDHKPSSGFCWVSVFPSPDGKFLVVNGCYWGGPYDYKVYDFRDPEMWPLIEVGYIESPAIHQDGSKEGVVWNEDGSLKIYVERLIRKRDGADVEDLYDRDEMEDDEFDELERMAGPNGDAEYRKLWATWERPPPEEIYATFVKTLKRRQDYNEKYPDRKMGTESITVQMERVWGWIPEGVRKGLTPLHISDSGSTQRS